MESGGNAPLENSELSARVSEEESLKTGIGPASLFATHTWK